MSQPEEVEALPADIERLLAGERIIPPETTVNSAEVFRAIQSSVAELPRAPSVGPAPSALGSKALIASISFLLGGVTVAILQSVFSTPVVPRITVVSVPAPMVAAETPQVRLEPSVPVVLPPSAVKKHLPLASPLPDPLPLGEREARPEADEQLAEERAVLEVARTALGRGRAETALSALVDHELRFPQGRLSEEREGLRVQALMSLGRVSEARSKLEIFKLQFPQSILAPALEEALNEKE